MQSSVEQTATIHASLARISAADFFSLAISRSDWVGWRTMWRYVVSYCNEINLSYDLELGKKFEEVPLDYYISSIAFPDKDAATMVTPNALRPGK